MTNPIHDFRVLSGVRPTLPSLSEAREGLSDEQLRILSESQGGAGLPSGIELKRKGKESYWYVKKGAVTLGVVSAHKGGTYDADTDPEGKGKFQGGFKSPMAAAQWVVKNNNGAMESVELDEKKSLKDQYKDAKKRAKEYPDSDWDKHARKLKKKMKGESLLRRRSPTQEG